MHKKIEREAREKKKRNGKKNTQTRLGTFSLLVVEN